MGKGGRTILYFSDESRNLSNTCATPLLANRDAVDLRNYFRSSHSICINETSFSGLLFAKAIQH